ncbi:MAG: hypothetical protein ABR505_07975 [Actinomycetota bacterium]
MDVIPKTDFDRSWQFILPDGTRLMFGRASVALLEHLPTTRPLGKIIRTLHLYWLVGAINKVFSWLRPHLGRFVADSPGPHRWP